MYTFYKQFRRVALGEPIGLLLADTVIGNDPCETRYGETFLENSPFAGRQALSVLLSEPLVRLAEPLAGLGEALVMYADP